MGLTSNEVRTTSSTGGQKGTKAQRVELVPPEAILALSEVYEFGSRKYQDHNFRKGYPWSLSYGAAQRHLNSWWAGEDLDPESGLSHLLHAAWHCFALFMFQQDHPDFDDRFSTVRDQFIPRESRNAVNVTVIDGTGLIPVEDLFDVKLAES